jgi:serpin B
MMRDGGDDVRYLDGDGFQAFELPYRGKNVRMLFVLPDMGNDAAVEAGLSPELFATVRSGMTERYVNYSVPRFSYRTSAELVTPLGALGVQQLFSDGADLSRMSSAGLHVSRVVHQAFVLVDEEGTEAAAATGVRTNLSSLPPPPITIVLDRPFLYAIYDEPTGEILFLGRLRDPS